METISKLREICQVSRSSPIYEMNWFDRKVLRWASIYVTRIFMQVGISENQVILIYFLIILMCGACFLLTSPYLWLVGVVLFLLYQLFDCCDGEIYRYHKSKGRETGLPFGFGAILGGVIDWFVWSYIFACMSFGLYFHTDNPWVFFFGFLAIIMRYLYQDMGLFPYPILHENDKLSEAIEGKDERKTSEPWLFGLGRLSFGARGFLIAVVAVSLIDLFCPVFTVWGLVWNARLVYLIIFGLAALAGLLLKLRDVYKHGVRIQRI